MATLLRPGSSLMSRTETRQLVVLYHGHCHIKMSHHSVLGGCRCEPRDNAVGRASVIRMWLEPPKGRNGEHTRRKGSSGCGTGHLGERIKPWCGKGLKGSPREAVIKVPVKCVLVSAALRG